MNIFSSFRGRLLAAGFFALVSVAGTQSVFAQTSYPWPEHSVLPIFFVPSDWPVSSSEVQDEKAAISSAMAEIRKYYAEATFGRTFKLNPLQVVQAWGPKESYGITWNGGNIYADGIDLASSFEGDVVAELHSRGFPTPPAQNEGGYSVMIFVKGAGGYAGGRSFSSADGGWAILGDWCIDSLQGDLSEWQYSWGSGRRLQIGAAAHELGHVFTLPHPPSAQYGQSIMGNWWDYPTIGLRSNEIQDMYAQRGDFFDHRTEHIVANNKLWVFDADGSGTWPIHGVDLTQVPRYAAGPCNGKSFGNCTFDTHSMVWVGTRLVESITAYGKYWNFDADDAYAPLGGNGSTLTSVGRYASGPCAGKTGNGCRFDSRTWVRLQGRPVESITAYGKYWNFWADTGVALGGNGSSLGSVSRYAAGPCAGHLSSCKFDSRTVVEYQGRALESITAYGKYWNFYDDGTLGGGSGSNLTSVGRYASGPCSGTSGSGCTFHSRSVYWIPGFTADPGGSDPADLRFLNADSSVPNSLWITQCRSDGSQLVWRVRSNTNAWADYLYSENQYDSCGSTSGAPWYTYPLKMRTAYPTPGIWITQCAPSGDTQYVWKTNGTRYAPFQYPETNTACPD